MSSSRRAAKVPAKARAKVPARAVKPAVPPADDASTQALRLAHAIEHAIAEGRLDVVGGEALQALVAAACRLYAARSESGESLTPVRKNSVAATDAMVLASGLLRATDLAVFELGMWQNWTGR